MNVVTVHAPSDLAEYPMRRRWANIRCVESGWISDASKMGEYPTRRIRPHIRCVGFGPISDARLKLTEDGSALTKENGSAKFQSCVEVW